MNGILKPRMAYKVTFTARSQNDLKSILNDGLGRYTPAQSLGYIQGMRRKCELLDVFPKRSTALLVRGKEYWRLTFKAHNIYYQVDDQEEHVFVVAILHNRMQFEARL